MSQFLCEVCGQGLRDGVAIFRRNPKGEKGIWRCEPHMDAPIPEDVKQITDILTREDRGSGR